MTTNPKTPPPADKARPTGKSRGVEAPFRETRRGGVAALAVNVPAITRAALGSRGFAEAGLLTHWPEIAGTDLARGCQPDKLRFPRGERRDGTLTLRCIGALALELQHQAPHLLERINGYFGYRAVARLQIVQGTLRRRTRPKPPLPALTAVDAAATEATIAPLQEGDLKDVLRRLGHAIRRRSKRAENR